MTKDIVLVGAGHAHVAVLRMFGMKPAPGARLTLITREVHTPYSGMLPGLIAGLYTFDQAHIDTGPLARFAGARLYRDEVTGIDVERGLVICAGRPPVPYDVLSLDIGSRPNTGDTPGATEHTIPVKPIDGFLTKFEAMRTRVLARAGGSRIALVGAGAGGVELLLSVERRLRHDMAEAGRDPASLQFTLVSATPDILPDFPAAFRAKFREVLRARGIAARTGSRVTRVQPGRLWLGDDAPLDADEILWTTQASAAGWLKETGLKLDARGFAIIDSMLRCEGHANIFAAGDTSAFAPRALPKSGVYAVRAGPVLAGNLRAVAMGEPPAPYRPQGDALYLVTTGEAYAVGARNGFTFSGEWVWRLKDWIDRRFMARFNELPDMAPAPGKGESDDMRCGGCGAKVGSNALSRALAGVEPLQSPGILLGLDAPDDAALVDDGGETLSVQTVDYFRAPVDDPFLFGKIAANHALGDIFAMGATARMALAIATLPHGPEGKVEADLAAMMRGANSVLREAGCALVGGHTGEGAELALGFAVTGRVARGAALRKSGMRAGDALVLTKPLGTGVVLAADMRGKARARDLMAAMDHMIQSSRAAGEILARHGATAATDVTGFGLVGHLREMTRASGVGARLFASEIPLLDGAREAAAAGIVSSLHPQNLRARDAIRDEAAAARLDVFPLLFDPQTAGGLLASVPAGRAADCVAALREAGYARAAIIGEVADFADVAGDIAIDGQRKVVRR